MQILGSRTDTAAISSSKISTRVRGSEEVPPEVPDLEPND